MCEDSRENDVVESAKYESRVLKRLIDTKLDVLRSQPTCLNEFFSLGQQHFKYYVHETVSPKHVHSALRAHPGPGRSLLEDHAHRHALQRL